jgi:hypothetical protein
MTAPAIGAWLANGPAVQGFVPTGAGCQGIDIRSELGQPVHAASSNKEIYAGSGLLGYGDGLIVKYSDQYTIGNFFKCHHATPLTANNSSRKENLLKLAAILPR